MSCKGGDCRDPAKECKKGDCAQLQNGKRTSAPTKAPTMFTDTPSAAPTEILVVDIRVHDIKTPMQNVRELTKEEIREWEVLMKKWFLDFFNGRRRRNLRALERRRNARVIDTEIDFVSQEVTFDSNGTPTNTITYDQTIIYEPAPQVSPEGETGHENSSSGLDREEQDDWEPDPNAFGINGLGAEELAALPYQDYTSNVDLVDDLRENIDSFGDVQFPMHVPDVPDQNTDDKDEPPPGLIAWVIVGVCTILATIFVFLMKRRASKKIAK